MVARGRKEEKVTRAYKEMKLIAIPKELNIEDKKWGHEHYPARYGKPT